MEAMRDVVDLLARLPGAEVPLPAPPVAWIALFYGLIALPLLPWPSGGLRRGLTWAGAGGGGAVVVLLPFAAGFRAPDPVQPRPDEVTVTVLAMGAGQCVVVAPPRGPLVLIDCGSGTLRDPLRRCIAPFVRHLGRNRVDRVILSHGDFDHLSAAADVVTAYGVREVMTGPHFRRHAVDNPPTAGLLTYLDETDRPVIELVPGNRISLGGGCAIDVLWPPTAIGGDVAAAEDLSSNDAGLVLKLTYAGRSVLFPADLQAVGQRGLLALDRRRLPADVLIAPHHGSHEETTAELIAAVDPAFVLSSNDRTLTLKQLDFERAVGAGRRLYRTHRDGSLTVRIARTGDLSVHAYQATR
jgi:competence protein ComEC